jgi:hypothetical protein
MGAGLILAHQPAETDHVRMQNGGEFPFPRGRSPGGCGGLSSRARIANAFDLAASDKHCTGFRSRLAKERGWTPVVRTVSHVTEPAEFDKYADLRQRYFGPPSPKSTTVPVPQLAGPDLLVQVKAFAAIR